MRTRSNSHFRSSSCQLKFPEGLINILHMATAFSLYIYYICIYICIYYLYIYIYHPLNFILTRTNYFLFFIFFIKFFLLLNSFFFSFEFLSFECCEIRRINKYTYIRVLFLRLGPTSHNCVHVQCRKCIKSLHGCGTRTTHLVWTFYLFSMFISVFEHIVEN